MDSKKELRNVSLIPSSYLF